MNRIIIVICLVCFFKIDLKAQHANDTLLFSIAMNSDTASIYGCLWNDKIRTTLAGPVLMADQELLFYSQNGYVLYSKKGKLLDSHSLFKQNSKAIKDGRAPVRLAYPLDSVTLLYYKISSGGTPEIFQKKLFKKELKKISGSEFAIYSDINSGQLFNLAHNSITDEMNRKTFLMPQLVGYTSLVGGIKWWAIDRFYSFSSPLIVEENGRCISFFPGLKFDQKCEFQKHLIEPLGVFSMDDQWYYYGLYSSLGNTEDEYYQDLVLCDQAGNIVYINKLLKEEITDAVLQHVKKTNTNFTVRRAARHVFVPAIAKNGDIFYGMIDFEYKKLNVYKRRFYCYSRISVDPMLREQFRDEADMAYTPVTLECNAAAKRGVRPEITRLTDDGFMTLGDEATVKNGFFISVHRITDEELKKKLLRDQHGLPPNSRHIQDSISALTTSWCPYAVSINHNERGKLGSLYYGLGDEVFSARVLFVSSAPLEIFVRVDLERMAEVIVFGANGQFKNRFTFNKQLYRDRKDLIVISDEGDIVEQDYECSQNGYKYFRWVLSAADSK